jgi:hypothetical protein
MALSQGKKHLPFPGHLFRCVKIKEFPVLGKELIKQRQGIFLSNFFSFLPFIAVEYILSRRPGRVSYDRHIY